MKYGGVVTVSLLIPSITGRITSFFNHEETRRCTGQRPVCTCRVVLHDRRTCMVYMFLRVWGQKSTCFSDSRGRKGLHVSPKNSRNNSILWKTTAAALRGRSAYARQGARGRGHHEAERPHVAGRAAWSRRDGAVPVGVGGEGKRTSAPVTVRRRRARRRRAFLSSLLGVRAERGRAAAT